MNDSVTDVLGAPYTAETIELPADVGGRGRRHAGQAARGLADATAPSCTCTASPTTSSRPSTPSGGTRAATTSTRWTCASTAGRSATHQTPNYVADLERLLPRPRRGLEPDHRPRRARPVVSQRALDRRPDRRPVGRRAAPGRAGRHGPQLAVVRPARAAPRSAPPAPRCSTSSATAADARIPRNVTGLYTRSLHRDHDGEWDFNLAWKPIKSWPVYAGWLRAIRIGPRPPARAASTCAARRWCCARTRTHPPKRWARTSHAATSCSTSTQIRRWAPALGRHVTVVAVEDALHDVVLSAPDVRKVVYDELDRWVSAYWTDPPATRCPRVAA